MLSMEKLSTFSLKLSVWFPPQYWIGLSWWIGRGGKTYIPNLITLLSLEPEEKALG